MSKAKIKWNTTKARAQFKAARKIFPKELEDGLNSGFEDFVAETKVRVPKQTTSLLDTATVEETNHGNVIGRKVTYGEPGEGPGVVDYAAAVHEIFDARHVPPTGPKYVEGPLVEAIPNFENEVSYSAETAKGKAFG